MMFDTVYLLVIPMVLIISFYAIQLGLKLWERYKLFLDYVEKNPSPTAALEYKGLKKRKEKTENDEVDQE